MKKIFVFIFIFVMFFTINAYSVTLPSFITNKVSSIDDTYKFVIYYEPSNYWLIVSSNYKAKNRSGTLRMYNGSESVEQTYYTTFDNGATWDLETSTAGQLSDYIVYSNHDIYDYYDDSIVFFSAPAEPFLPAKETTSLVPTVGRQSVPILVVSVVILGLMIAVTLIPRVLYRLL